MWYERYSGKWIPRSTGGWIQSNFCFSFFLCENCVIKKRKKKPFDRFYVWIISHITTTHLRINKLSYFENCPLLTKKTKKKYFRESTFL